VELQTMSIEHPLVVQEFVCPYWCMSRVVGM
jgi:hypothetical protein